ncbi:unnamed protein product [Coregonus sp. 'balchen']|nr:unnamed protein product [Coregonus sp. 'balchen']
MGNWCCPAASPCDNVEERSGLLHGGVKDPASSSECGEVAGFHNGSKADSEVRKAGGDDAEENKEKEVAVVTVQVWRSVSPKTNRKEDTAQPQTIEKNGLLQTEDREDEEPSPITDTGLIANSILTALDKSTEDIATESTNVEAQICTSDPPQGPHKEDARGGGDAEKVPAEIEAVAEQTSPVVQNEHSDNITITPDAKDKCPEAFSLKAEIPVESITSETVDEVSTIPLHNAVDVLSEPEKCCLGTVEVTSLPDTQLTPPEASEEAASTDSVPHLPSSPSPTSTVIKGVDDKENRSSVAHLDDSPQDPEASPALTEATEPTQNGLVPLNFTGLVKEPVKMCPSKTSNSQNSCEEEKEGIQCGLTEVPSLEDLLDEGEEEEVPETKEQKEKEEMKESAAAGAMTGDETGGEEVQKGEALRGPSTSADLEVLPVREGDGPAGEDLGVSEEDLYRGAEELPQGPVKHAGPEPLFEITLPKVEDRCSLEPTLDIMSYSEREWKGNTAKSTLIRKGYTELSQRFGSLRRVRGDNYCALRATLFQVLSTSTQLPVWLQDEHISMREGREDAVQQLKRYMKLLQNRWQAAVGCSSAEERLRLCERVFQGGEEELGLLEALKLLMLGRAVELHTTMQEGGDVPVFCWLLYARDSSDCPRTFLSNHLSQVGFSGGLEQVEMFLLGYALQCTIQVYRLYMAHTEEFVTYFPDDHKEDWPCVCLVTEDDRHYNVPVGQPNGLQVPEDLTAS